MSAAFLIAGICGPRVSAQSGVAYLAVDLKTGKTLRSVRSDIIDTAILPGSVIKIAALAAALDAGVIDANSGALCRRSEMVAGHRLVCTHPDLHRLLTPSEALAHSCNSFVASVAGRLPRAALDRALNSLGLASSDRGQPVAAVALGIEGIRATPRQLLEAIRRVGEEPNRLGWRPTTLATIREGLRGAARYGTASALAQSDIDALAKTGTVVRGGVSQGVVVGVTPSVKPTIGFVLVASGPSGADAARLAAARLASSSPQTLLRLGITRADGTRAVRSIELDEYVAGVVAGEAVHNSGSAALEALAITVRTFALANRGRHAADGFDLCDLTHCQVFRAPTAATRRAASATSGRVLLAGASMASVYYSASCGGYTERPSAVWPGAADPAYLPSRRDDACLGEPPWTSEIAITDLVRALNAGGFKGARLRDVEVIGRDASGRVAQLRLNGLSPDEISGEDFRMLIDRTLGWNVLKSTAFELRRTGSGFRTLGHGLGHGVGLCVTGSARLAEHGATAEQILEHYFPGTHIGSSSSFVTAPAVIVDLPVADQGARDALHDLTVRLRDALSTRLGAPIPTQIALQFHPTVESYQRATRQPWFTAGAVVEGKIHLIPLAALRKRGLLEQTIGHELVHVLARTSLSGRPLWVMEGAAAYFAEEPLSQLTNESCPTDQELQRPDSAEAMREAYARAAACFSRQIKSGKTWRSVR